MELLYIFGHFLGKEIFIRLVKTYRLQHFKENIYIYIYYFRENITAVENRIAHANKRIVEAEFKLQKLKEECIKEQVKSDNIFYD